MFNWKLTIKKIKQPMETELFMQLHCLVQDWEGKEDYNVPSHIITEMFTVHNRFFPDKPEYSKSCGGCRQRVWNRLKAYYHAEKTNFGL